ncbi:MAG: flagellar basal body P-ring protein FlgI [Thermodesulfobacteriota bacterium]
MQHKANTKHGDVYFREKSRGSLVNRTICLALFVACLSAFLLPATVEAVRLKNIASFSGARSNQLVGYGLVVGLSGTGDQRGSPYTIQSMTNMMENMGVRVDKEDIQPQNVAAVMVTADLSVSSEPGSELDVTVSSVGDAESLHGGVLLMTPLKGVDDKVYAIAQGPLTLGGHSAGGEAAEETTNFTTVGTIPQGAVVERSVPYEFNEQDKIQIDLNVGGFTTVQRVVNSINRELSGKYAKPKTRSSLELEVPAKFSGNLIPLMAKLEQMQVNPDKRAKVVVDEKTGTIVLGSDVTLSPVAVAQGNLKVRVEERPQVSQPAPFSEGETAVEPRTDVEVEEEEKRLTMMEGTRLQELVEGLNAIGATPRDLISILRTLKSAGALHAQLEVQ